MGIGVLFSGGFEKFGYVLYMESYFIHLLCYIFHCSKEIIHFSLIRQTCTEFFLLKHSCITFTAICHSLKVRVIQYSFFIRTVTICIFQKQQ